MYFSDRVIIASGLADQSYLHVYKRSLNGWSISNPEKINLSSILRSDGNFIDKNFTGFSHMVYVTVSLITNMLCPVDCPKNQYIRGIKFFDDSIYRLMKYWAERLTQKRLFWDIYCIISGPI